MLYQVILVWTTLLHKTAERLQHTAKYIAPGTLLFYSASRKCASRLKHPAEDKIMFSCSSAWFSTVRVVCPCPALSPSASGPAGSEFAGMGDIRAVLTVYIGKGGRGDASSSRHWHLGMIYSVQQYSSTGHLLRRNTYASRRGERERVTLFPR